MSKKISAILLSTLFLISVPGLVVGDVVKDIAKKAAEAAFTEAERQAIEKYYEVTAPIRGEEYEKDHDDSDDKEISVKKKKDKGKSKGKNKRKELPKGIAKKLERGGTLPPGIAKRELPVNLEKELPPAPEGYERIVADGRVMLSNIATGIISDIINIDGKSDAVSSKEQQAAKNNIPKEENIPEKSEKKWWELWKD